MSLEDAGQNVENTDENNVNIGGNAEENADNSGENAQHVDKMWQIPNGYLLCLKFG